MIRRVAERRVPVESRFVEIHSMAGGQRMAKVVCESFQGSSVSKRLEFELGKL